MVHAALGQQKQDAEMVKAAQQYFQLVGASASECDTIPGRQCMASCFHLLGQFDDVLIFLNSILQVCMPWMQSTSGWRCTQRHRTPRQASLASLTGKPHWQASLASLTAAIRGISRCGMPFAACCLRTPQESLMLLHN